MDYLVDKFTILHIITGLENGGAEAVLLRLASFDQRHGNQHHVISLMDRGIYADCLEQAGVPVHTLNFARGKVNAAGFLKLFRLVRQIQPDVVQTWMYHANLIGGAIAWIAGVRAISWSIHHANLDRRYNSLATLFVVKLGARFSKWLPRKIVCPSLLAIKIHQEIGYKSDAFVGVANSCSLDDFQCDANKRKLIRNELNIQEDAFVIGMVARFNAQKDHGNLIKALGLLRRRDIPFACLLIGADMGEVNDTLRGWVESAGVAASQVRLLGPRSDVPAVMNALDVHVLSSLGEAFGNVLAEAMACGTPCVTTDVGAAALIVADLGWVVPPQDAVALADSIGQAYAAFVGNKPAWQTRRAACRAHIMANFELERMCERYRQVWQACMQPTQTNRAS